MPPSSLAGSIPAVLWPDWFIREQLDRPVPHNSDNALTVAQQLGNCYGLLFMLGVVVLYTSSELRVVRNYLVALLIADLGHIAVTYYILEFDKFIAFRDWNPMTWGNVGVTVRRYGWSPVLRSCSLVQLTLLLTAIAGFPVSDPDGLSHRPVRSRCLPRTCGLEEESLTGLGVMGEARPPPHSYSRG